MPGVVALYESVRNPRLQPEVAQITARFEELSGATTDDELQCFVEDFMSSLGQITDALRTAPTLAAGVSAPLLMEHATGKLTEVQQRAIALIELHLYDAH